MVHDSIIEGGCFYRTVYAATVLSSQFTLAAKKRVLYKMLFRIRRNLQSS